MGKLNNICKKLAVFIGIHICALFAAATFITPFCLFMGIRSYIIYHSIPDMFIVSSSPYGDITVYEDHVGFFDSFSMSMWTKVDGFSNSIFEVRSFVDKFDYRTHKRVLDRRIAIPMYFDDVPYQIEVSVDAVIENPQVAVFSVMVDPSLCRRIESNLISEVRDKLKAYSLGSPHADFNGPIFTKYRELGFAYSMTIVGVIDVNTQSKTLMDTLQRTRADQDAFARTAKLNSRDAIRTLRAMDKYTQCIEQKDRDLHRTNGYFISPACRFHSYNWL